MSAHTPNRPTTIPALDGADPLVVVENLTKTYRDQHALDGLSLELPPGRIIGLMGSNGSGKTTLLKILAGVLADYDGRVRIAGHDPGPESKALVSFLPDASFLAPGLTVPAAISQSRRLFADFDADKAAELVRFFSLPADRTLKEMSKGMGEKLRVSLAMSRRARGYLTMSLPVRGRVIFTAKTLYAVIAGLVSAAVAALLGVGWLATYVHLRGTTLEELLQAVRQMISMVGAGILVFYGLAVVGGAVVTIIEVAAVMSIGAQGRWNRLGFGAPAVGFVILYAVNQIVSLVAALLLPLSLDLTSGRIVTRMMLPQFIEAVRLDQEPQLVGIGSVVVAPILAAILAWWAVRAIERHTCLR